MATTITHANLLLGLSQSVHTKWPIGAPKARKNPVLESSHCEVKVQGYSTVYKAEPKSWFPVLSSVPLALVFMVLIRLAYDAGLCRKRQGWQRMVLVLSGHQEYQRVSVPDINLRDSIIPIEYFHCLRYIHLPDTSFCLGHVIFPPLVFKSIYNSAKWKL